MILVEFGTHGTIESFELPTLAEAKAMVADRFPDAVYENGWQTAALSKDQDRGDADLWSLARLAFFPEGIDLLCDHLQLRAAGSLVNLSPLPPEDGAILKSGEMEIGY